MNRLAMLVLVTLVGQLAGCTLFSRAVPCDDAGDCPVPFDACVDGACTVSLCGNGVVDIGEACDDANTNDSDACVVCQAARCGDGAVQAGVEPCDDGNTIDNDACVGCVAARCGDGFVFDEASGGNEACDDDNVDNTDACLDTCQLASCGDGFVQVGQEECEDGNTDNTDDCTNVCKLPTCGDGFIRPPEVCDDGNQETDDDCVNCRDAKCRDGFVQAIIEGCDDGNTENDDDCTSFCSVSRCGDGVLRAGTEECDDGNDIETDVCTGACRFQRFAITARETDTGCGGFALVDGAVVELASSSPGVVAFGSTIGLFADAGCSINTILGCAETGTGSCVVGADVEVSFATPSVTTTLSGSGDVRVTDAALVDGELTVVGDRDGDVSPIEAEPPTATPQAFALGFDAAQLATALSPVDLKGDARTRLDVALGSGATTVLVGTSEAGMFILGGCSTTDRSIHVLFDDGLTCETVELGFPAATAISIKGAAGSAGDLWILADVVAAGPVLVGATLVDPGAILIHVPARSAAATTIINLASIDPVAIAVVDGRVAVGGRVESETVALPCAPTPTPGIGESIVALISPTNGLCTSGVGLLGPSVELTALAAHGGRLVAAGSWASTLKIGGRALIDSDGGRDGFVIDFDVADPGSLTTVSVRTLEGSDDDGIIDVFIDDREMGVLFTTTAAARFNGIQVTTGAGTFVTTVARSGTVHRTVPVPLGTGGRAFGLRRGSGSAMIVLGERPTPVLVGFVIMLGAP